MMMPLDQSVPRPLKNGLQGHFTDTTAGGDRQELDDFDQAVNAADHDQIGEPDMRQAVAVSRRPAAGVQHRR